MTEMFHHPIDQSVYCNQTDQTLIAQARYERTRQFLNSSLSANTRRAIAADLQAFQNWGGAIPASEEMIMNYLADRADDLSIITLKRHLASISKLHSLAGHDNPARSDKIKMLVRGIAREYGCMQRQAAPLLRDDLISIINALGDDPKSLRDKALLITGFAGALRRSELSALNRDDIEMVSEGMIMTIRISKTDQEGRGRKLAVPYSHKRLCPVRSVESWIKYLPDDHNPLFRSIRKGGSVQEQRLSDHTVSTVVKQYVQQIGLDPDAYSGHSLRSGFVTSAAQMGLPEWKIMRQSGHKSHQTMMRYIRDARLFDDHPLQTMF